MVAAGLYIPTLADRARSAGQSEAPGQWDGLVAMWRPSLGVQGWRLFDVGPFGYMHAGRGGSGAPWATGNHGWAAAHNGTDDEWGVGSGHLLTGMSELTLHGRVKFTGGSRVAEDTIIERWRTTSSYLLRYDSATSKIEFWTRTSAAKGGGFDGTSLDDGQWHTIDAVYDGSTMHVYVDATASATTYAQSGTIGSNTLDLYIGSQGSIIDFWRGLLDDLRIYRRGLSAAEIRRMHRDPLAIVRRSRPLARLTETPPVPGPCRIEQGQLFSTGNEAGDVFHTGGQAGGTFSTGQLAGRIHG